MMIFKKKKGFQSRKSIVVVSGLPRSGTSLMMKMLAAGGIPPLTDHHRTADEDNPKGYYEFERVKKLPDGDIDWLKDARGKAVKIITALVPHLPKNHRYYIIVMRRHIDEILASQSVMLTRRGTEESNRDDQQMKETFAQHLKEFYSWVRAQDHISYIDIDYNELLSSPSFSIRKINLFLGETLDTQAMEVVIDPSLYRQRKKEIT